MFSGLSHYSRVLLRHFLAAWTTPDRPVPRIPSTVAKAMAAQSEALERGDTQLISWTRRRVYAARHEALRAEMRGAK